jgi:malonyl CoA-acyl carrier protein transacylase
MAGSMKTIRPKVRDSQLSVRMNADCAALAPVIAAISEKHNIKPRTVVRIALANIGKLE